MNKTTMFTLQEIQFLFGVLLKHRDDHDMNDDQSDMFQSVMEKLSNYSVRKMALEMKFKHDDPDQDILDKENVISLRNYKNQNKD